LRLQPLIKILLVVKYGGPNWASFHLTWWCQDVGTPALRTAWLCRGIWLGRPRFSLSGVR